MLRKETTTFDIKSLRTVKGKSKNFDELAKDCVAFANARGGNIHIGIEDGCSLPPESQTIEEDLPGTVQLRISQLTINTSVVANKVIAENGGEYIDLLIHPSVSTIAGTTDGRYFIQADKELNGSGISLMKLRTPGYPSINEWIEKNIKENETLGFDGRLFSINQYEEYLNISKKKKFNINMEKDLLNLIWNNREDLPKSKVFLYDEKYSGKSAKEKLNEVRKNINENNADYFILSSLDDIAWLCNIRANDIKFNPVVLSYVIVGKDYANIYIDNEKIDEETRSKLNFEGFKIKHYESI